MVDIKRARRALVLLVLLTLLFAACGGDAGGGIEVGSPAPAFSLQSADGSTVSLGGYEEPVLLFFHMADG